MDSRMKDSGSVAPLVAWAVPSVLFRVRRTPPPCLWMLHLYCFSSGHSPVLCPWQWGGGSVPLALGCLRALGAYIEGSLEDTVSPDPHPWRESGASRVDD